MTSENVIDEGKEVRESERFDVDAVDNWLKRQDPSLRGLPQVTQFSGGASNWTYRLAYENRDLILRRPPAGTKAKSAHDMAREFNVQRALKPVFAVVPAMVGLCQDLAVIGSDFYVMERVAGIIPRKNMPKGLALDVKQTRQLCLNVIDKLIELHRVDAHAIGLTALGKGPGYPRRQIEGWNDRFHKALTWNVSGFKYVRAWLQDHIPNDVATCVIHNDWRFDNVVLAAEDPTRVIGALDWEMATLGDPLMDLGNSLAYWVHADDNFFMRATRRQPTHLPGMLRREELVEYYLSRTGYKLEKWAFYEVYGLFRLAVIAQQIYYRYHHKQTRNPAFKNFWILANYLGWRCHGIIKRSKS